WVDVASGITGADGAVGIPFTIDASATFRILVQATESTPEVVSAEFPIAVSSTVSARAKKKVVKRGAKWKKVASAKTKANGRIMIKSKAKLSKGKYTFRVLAKPKSGIQAGISGTFTMRIK
nr:hypothetical protein [Actinomycetes bacterium]